VSGVALLNEAADSATLFVRDRHGLWSTPFSGVESARAAHLTSCLYTSSNSHMHDGVPLEGSIETHGRIALQDSSLLVADPAFAALRVLSSTSGLVQFLDGLCWLHRAGGLDSG
jgi:hypothetical protein